MYYSKENNTKYMCLRSFYSCSIYSEIRGSRTKGSVNYKNDNCKFLDFCTTLTTERMEAIWTNHDLRLGPAGHSGTNCVH